MKRLIVVFLILIMAAVTATPQKNAGKSVFGANVGLSVPYNEFAYNTLQYNAGFASIGPNIEAEFLRYGRFIGFSSSIGYSSLFFNEKDYQAEYDRVLDGYGTNEVDAGNYQLLRFLIGFTLKLPEIEHTEVMLLFHLGYAISIHPDLTVTNSKLGVINSVARSRGDSPVINTGAKINYWINERCGVSLNGGLNFTRPSFNDETGPEGFFYQSISYVNINAGLIMKINRPGR